jgi:hypothetical protein
MKKMRYPTITKVATPKAPRPHAAITGKDIHSSLGFPPPPNVEPAWILLDLYSNEKIFFQKAPQEPTPFPCHVPPSFATIPFEGSTTTVVRTERLTYTYGFPSATQAGC